VPGRKAGVKNRNYPPLRLGDALKVAMKIQDEAGGMTVSRLTLAELLDVSPSSANFNNLVASSRFYGLTNGGINADEFSLTPLGESATGADEVAQLAAYKSAVMNVEPYRLFFEAFANKKLPSGSPLKEFLVKSARVPPERVDECIEFILADANTAGLFRTLKGAHYIDLAGAPSRYSEDEANAEDDDAEEAQEEEAPGTPDGAAAQAKKADSPKPAKLSVGPKKVFIAHGKNRTPLDQLKSALDTFKVVYAVAVDEPNAGRPISKKVANLMRDECSSGIFIFTADERFLRENAKGDHEEVWRPSENVVYELGAASILYENRIVIFKEKGVTFPTDFSDLGYISFEKDQLVAELGNLFKELVGLDILEVRAKG
jgi:predicted nucleotide-binding protein